MKPSISWIRRSQRLIRMVCELHRMGYQRLRIMPYEYPIAWRLLIGPKGVFRRDNGALIADSFNEGNTITYSSASENEYFGWTDAKKDDAKALALKFIERFPEIAEASKGRDWEYAGWLVELMGVLERDGGLPVMFSEYDGPDEGVVGIFFYDETSRPTGEFPLPPGGEADAPETD